MRDADPYGYSSRDGHTNGDGDTSSADPDSHGDSSATNSDAHCCSGDSDA
jgi:hypothetical protein